MDLTFDTANSTTFTVHYWQYIRNGEILERIYGRRVLDIGIIMGSLGIEGLDSVSKELVYAN